MKHKHIRYLRRALALARRGGRDVRPNPLVGALVVKNGAVLGAGWHEACGSPHAEVIALQAAGTAAKGARLYVTLEPCNHHGRTGPCTEAILAAGIRELIYCSNDPNSKVRGGGGAYLAAQGLHVESGMLESEERELNAPWYHWLESGQPLVTGLVGAGLNGIFELSEQERAPLHRFGNRYDGELSGNKVVLSGGGEVAIDPNPKILLQRLGASNIQSLLISSTSQVEKFLSAGLLSRLLSVHASKFSSKPVEFPRARLALLRLRPREAVSVYKVLS